MPIYIKDPETDRLARALAAATGESLTAAIRRAIEERLARAAGAGRPGVRTAVRRIQQRVAALAVRDARAADAIVGFDEHGAPR